jgi:hypothetical protein
MTEAEREAAISGLVCEMRLLGRREAARRVLNMAEGHTHLESRVAHYRRNLAGMIARERYWFWHSLCWADTNGNELSERQIENLRAAYRKHGGKG